MDESVVKTVQIIELVGKEQYKSYFKSVLVERQLLKQGLDWDWTGAGLEQFS